MLLFLFIAQGYFHISMISTSDLLNERNTHIQADTHTHTDIYTHTNTHTHTHTHTHSNIPTYTVKATHTLTFTNAHKRLRVTSKSICSFYSYFVITWPWA